MKSSLLLPAVALALAMAAPHTQAAPNMVGKALPEAKLHYFDGAVDLKGKPAIVEFWATWCGPCRAVIPHLNDLYSKYKEKGLTIVGVSVDEEKADVEKFRAKLGMEYPVAFDEGKKLSTALNIEAIPYAFVVDKAGKVVWEGISSQLKEETIEQILK